MNFIDLHPNIIQSNTKTIRCTWKTHGKDTCACGTLRLWKGQLMPVPRIWHTCGTTDFNLQSAHKCIIITISAISNKVCIFEHVIQRCAERQVLPTLIQFHVICMLYPHMRSHHCGIILAVDEMNTFCAHYISIWSSIQVCTRHYVKNRPHTYRIVMQQLVQKYLSGNWECSVFSCLHPQEQIICREGTYYVLFWHESEFRKTYYGVLTG